MCAQTPSALTALTTPTAPTAPTALSYRPPPSPSALRPPLYVVITITLTAPTAHRLHSLPLSADYFQHLRPSWILSFRGRRHWRQRVNKIRMPQKAFNSSIVTPYLLKSTDFCRSSRCNLFHVISQRASSRMRNCGTVSLAAFLTTRL